MEREIEKERGRIPKRKTSDFEEEDLTARTELSQPCSEQTKESKTDDQISRFQAFYDESTKVNLAKSPVAQVSPLLPPETGYMAKKDSQESCNLCIPSEGDDEEDELLEECIKSTEIPSNLKSKIIERLQRSYSTTEESMMMDTLNKYQRSVGIIRWPTPQSGFRNATVFRMGRNFVMTNFHVLDQIERDQEKCRFGLSEVKIYFNFCEGSYENREYVSLNLKGNEIECTFASELNDLDFAIFEVGASPNDLPAPLGIFISKFPSLSSRFCIMGHPNGQHLQIDVRCVGKVDEIQNLPAIFKLQGMPPSDVMQACDSRRTLYHTNMTYGSSGSPIFSYSGDLLGIHVRGFYRREARRSEFEQGVAMTKIINHIVHQIRQKHTSDNIDVYQQMRSIFIDLFPNHGHLLPSVHGSTE
ncbi:serine protease FAM111A-like [Ptychodera flava]|uniref:serine protease FAM111A-like n=1 Tax=Ptychodera flava TaxID=63121 RepID=UPI003969BCFC